MNQFRKSSGLQIEAVGITEAKSFCVKWHYSNIFPPHCTISLGYRDDKGLAGVALWGWGVRPKHTIQKLFPTLGTEDYWELNRLCLRDDCPRNSESWFLAQCAKWIHKHCPKKRMLISWADGMRGKPGYVYQASNWLYGGFITTEIYLTPDGEPVHPRMIVTRHGDRKKETTEGLGLRKVWGRQFIYALPLGTTRQTKSLFDSSPNQWGRNYPKHDSLVWGNTATDFSEGQPVITQSGKFRDPEPSIFDYEEEAA